MSSPQLTSGQANKLVKTQTFVKPVFKIGILIQEGDHTTKCDSIIFLNGPESIQSMLSAYILTQNKASLIKNKLP